MTTPIPESAVEAARACWMEMSDDANLEKHGPDAATYTLDDMLTQALTAASPLMEDEALSAWADYFDHYDDGPGRDPLTASKAAQLLRGPRPFGIAERNQR